MNGALCFKRDTTNAYVVSLCAWNDRSNAVKGDASTTMTITTKRRPTR